MIITNRQKLIAIAASLAILAGGAIVRKVAPDIVQKIDFGLMQDRAQKEDQKNVLKQSLETDVGFGQNNADEYITRPPLVPNIIKPKVF